MSADGYATFTVRIPRAMNEKLEKVADENLSSKNREVTIAIRAHLDSHKRGAR